MRGLNGIISGGFLALAGSLMAWSQSAGAGTTIAAAVAGLIVGIGAALVAAPQVERQDRIAFTATVFLLFAAMIWTIESVLAPILVRMLGTSPPAPDLVLVLAPLIPAILLYRLTRQLLDFDARDLSLWPDGTRPRWPPMAAAVTALVAAGVAGTWLGRSADTAEAVMPVVGVAAGAVRIGFEEFFYRGFLLSAFRDRLGTGPAVAIQAVLYAVAGSLGPETNVLGALARLAAGALAGMITAETRFLLPAWAARTVGALIGRLIV